MAFNAPQIGGTPYTGVDAQSPPNFSIGKFPITNQNVTQYNVGDEYLDQTTGIWYKLLLVGTQRLWANQGTVGGDLQTLTTSDAVVVSPLANNINITQGNGILTTGSAHTVTVSMSGSYTGNFAITGNLNVTGDETITGNTILNGNETINGTLLVTGSSLSPLSIVSTDAGASAGPILDVYRNSASPAASDSIGEITLTGKSSTGNKRTYGQILGTIVSPTNASENGSIAVSVMSAGTLTSQGVWSNTGLSLSPNPLTITATSGPAISATTTSLSGELIASTATGASAGPILELYRNKATGSASDRIGQINFTGASSTGIQRTYASVSGYVQSATNASEYGAFEIFVQSAGTLTEIAYFDQQGLTVSSTSANPLIIAYRNSASPAASDIIGQLIFKDNNASATGVNYGGVYSTIVATTAGAENASLTLWTVSAGVATTQLLALNTGCQVRGNNANTTPPAGYLGEILQGQVTSGSAVTINASATTVTSISLTAGTWDIAWFAVVDTVASTGTITAAISSTTNSLGSSVNGYSQINFPVSTAGVYPLVIPKVRVTLGSTTTYYGVAKGVAAFNTGYGTLTATRVG